MTILIADTDLIYRRGLKSLISEKRGACLEVDGLHSLKEWCSSNQASASILLLDGNLALELAGSLSSGTFSFGSCRRAALMDQSNVAFADLLLKKGFHGLVLKNNIHDIGICIEHLWQQKRYVCSGILNSLVGTQERELYGEPYSSDLLTEKEKSILQLTYQELSAKQIADKLSLSTRTVEWYRKKMMEKTNSKNMIGLIRFGIEQKILNA